MKSKIDIAEFNSRLSKNTLIGNPNINGTPFVAFSMFYSSDRKYFGRINKNTFEITTNETFKSIPYKIKGIAKSSSNATTSIKYAIKPIWFGYLWIRILPLTLIIVLFATIIKNSDLIIPFSLFGSIFTLMSLFNIYRSKQRLKNFELDFKRTFEII